MPPPSWFRPTGFSRSTPACSATTSPSYRAIAPSCFVQVGMLAPEKDCCYAHHHGMFKVDEDVLPLCAAWMAANGRPRRVEADFSTGLWKMRPVFPV